MNDTKITGHPIYEILAFLDKHGLHYSLSRMRSETVDISVTLVGMRIEVSVFEDGHIEYSKFEGSEDVLSNMSALFALLRHFQ